MDNKTTKKLNLDEIRNSKQNETANENTNVASLEDTVDDDLIASVNEAEKKVEEKALTTASSTESYSPSNPGSIGNSTADDLDQLDKEIEEEEKAMLQEEQEPKALDSIKSIDEEDVINDVIKEDEKELLRKEQQEAENTAKSIVEEMFNDENLELNEDEIYKKKEQEAKREETRKRNQEIYLNLKESFQDNIIKKDQVDLTGFRISKTPISVSKILTAPMSNARVGAWGLYHSGRAIAMTEIGGGDLEIITQETSSNELVDQLHSFQIIHKHDIDPNKGTLEQWLQKMTYLDLADLNFCVYKASFQGANYLSYQCTNKECNNAWMKEKPMKEMVKYKDDATKERMLKIIQKDPTTKTNITSKLIQVSPDIVVSITAPSLFKLIFEQRILSPEFRKNNEVLMNILVYIDNIYRLNKDDMMLYPVDTRPDPDNIDLTVKRRVSIYSKILTGLTSDQFWLLQSKIAEYDRTNSDEAITYQYPEDECPKCHTIVPAQNYNPVAMLFLRHRLGRVLNFSRS